MKIKSNRHLIYVLVTVFITSILCACDSTSNEAQTDTVSNEMTTAEVTSEGIDITETASSEDVHTESIPTDYDGNTYESIQIGNQVWMTENFRSTHLGDGTPLDYFECNGDTSNNAVYGLLYDLEAIISLQNAPPEGWHIPTESDWEELINYFGSSKKAAEQMITSDYWPNSAVIVSPSGFNASPAGMYDFTGVFQWFGDAVVFASSASDVNGVYYYIKADNIELLKGNFHPSDAVSIRFIKDN